MKLQLEQDPPVPGFLIPDVLAKLAYVDERVKAAQVNGAGDQVELTLNSELSEVEAAAVGDRVRLLINAMADGAFEPELRVIEEHWPEIRCGADPMPELLARREVVQEGTGFFCYWSTADAGHRVLRASNA